MVPRPLVRCRACCEAGRRKDRVLACAHANCGHSCAQQASCKQPRRLVSPAHQQCTECQVWFAQGGRASCRSCARGAAYWAAMCALLCSSDTGIQHAVWLQVKAAETICPRPARACRAPVTITTKVSASPATQIASCAQRSIQRSVITRTRKATSGPVRAPCWSAHPAAWETQHEQNPLLFRQSRSRTAEKLRTSSDAEHANGASAKVQAATAVQPRCRSATRMLPKYA